MKSLDLESSNGFVVWDLFMATSSLLFLSKGGTEEDPEEEELNDDEEVEVEGVDEVDITPPTLLSVPMMFQVPTVQHRSTRIVTKVMKIAHASLEVQYVHSDW